MPKTSIERSRKFRKKLKEDFKYCCRKTIKPMCNVRNTFQLIISEERKLTH